MFWILAVGVVVFLIFRASSSSKKVKKVNTELGPIFARHSRELLKEEFPQIADRLTTTFCMEIYRHITQSISERTGTADFMDGVKAFAKLSQDEQEKLVEDGNKEVFDKLPQEIQDHVTSADDGYERFNKANELAGELAMAELMKAG